MASGKVRSPVTFDFPVTDGSFLIYAHNMPVECPFGSDMDVKTVPSGDFKEHSSRDPFPGTSEADRTIFAIVYADT